MTDIEKWLTSFGFEISGRSTVEALFANGYNLGLLICKLGIGDFTEDVFRSRFEDSLEDSAITKNFQTCKESLQLISIKLKANQIKKLQEENVGFAPAFLYELKTWWMRERQRQSYGRNILKNREPKEKSASDKSRFFKSVASLRNSKNLNDRSNLFLQRFENQMLDIQSDATENARAEELQTLRKRDQQYRNTRRRLHETIDLTNEINQIGTQKWMTNIKQKRHHEFVDLQWELTKQKDKKNRKERFRAAREHEMMNEIDGFEKILRAQTTKSPIHGLKTVQDEIDDAAERVVDKPPEGITQNDAESFELKQVQEHMEKLKKLLPTTLAMNEAATVQLKRIKEKIENDVMVKKATLRETLHPQQDCIKEEEGSKVSEEVFQAAVSKNKEETEVYDLLWRARQSGKIMKANRLARLHRIKKARDVEYEVGMQHDRQTYLKIRNETNTVVSEKVEKEKVEREKQQKQEKADNLRYCEHLVSELVDLGFKSGEWLNVSEDELIPPKIWREWIQQMWDDMEAHNLQDLNMGDETPNVLELEESFSPMLEEPCGACVDVVNEVEYKDYVNLVGMWKESTPAAKSIPSISDSFAKLVDGVVNISVGSPVPSKPLKPAFKLGFVFIGPRFSGKTSLAMEVTRRWALWILQPTDLIQEAVTSVELFEKSEDPEKAETPQIEIGRRVKKIVDSDDGESVTDELYVELLIEAINREKDNAESNGWIIDGFPSNLEQAKLLEAKLSGFGDAVGKGKGKKQKSKKKEAVEDSATVNTPPQSGIDSVFRFRFDIPQEKSVEVLLERARAMRVDPETKKIYHLTHYPPPEDDIIEARLVAIPETEVETMGQDSVEKFDETANGMQKWWEQFKINRELDCNMEIDIMVDAVEKEIQVVLAKKEEEAKLLSEAEPSTTPAEENAEDQGVENTKLEEEQEQQDEEKTTAPITLTDRRKCKLLHKRWNSIECSFESSVTQLIASLRKERRRRTGYICFLRRNFATYLKRPNDAAKFLRMFLTDYNKIHPDLRKAEYIKDELSKKIEELKGVLWSCALQRKDEAVNKLEYMRNSGWELAANQVTLAIASRILQAELLRHLQTTEFIGNYFYLLREWPVSDTKVEIEGYQVKPQNESPRADSLEQLVRMKRLYLEKIGKGLEWDDKFPEMHEQMKLLYEAEKIVFQRRVERVHLVMKTWIEGTKEKMSSVFQDLDNLIASWVKGENRAIDSMVYNVKLKIEEESALAELRLTGSNFFVNKALVAQLIPDPIKEPVLPAPSRDAVFSAQQLLSLATAFKHAIPNGLEKLDSVVEVFNKLKGVVYKNKLSALPKLWDCLTMQQLRVVLSQFVVANESVDWRRLMVNLVLEHITFISGTSGVPPLETILFMKNSLRGFKKNEELTGGSVHEEVAKESDNEMEQESKLLGDEEEDVEAKPDEILEKDTKDAEEDVEAKADEVIVEETKPEELIKKETKRDEIVEEETKQFPVVTEKQFSKLIGWCTNALPLADRSVVCKALFESVAFGTAEQLLLQLCFTDAEYSALEKAVCVLTCNSSTTEGSVQEIRQILSHYSLFNMEEVAKEFVKITNDAGLITIDQIMKSELSEIVVECFGSRVYDCLKVSEE